MARTARVHGSARHSARTAVVWDALADLLGDVSPGEVPEADPVAAAAVGRLTVVDLGGGSGGFAVPLAERGYRVTVVDASADALATLGRRATDHDVPVHAVQGDATDLPALVGDEAADLVLCHNVLEYVDDPAAALAAVRRVLRPGGTVSVLVPNRTAAVVHRALGGRFAEARHALDGADGRWGELDPIRRRFSLGGLTDLLAAAGLVAGVAHGVRVFADLVPGGLADGETGSADALLALERAAAQHPELRALATQLHVLATRPT